MKIQWMFLLLAAALLVGCSSETGNSKRPKTYAATGVVTLNGAPLEGATVNFYPLEGTGSSVGLTDKDGKYSLSTFTSDDGAPPGQYKVSIVKFAGNAPPPSAAAPAAGELASGEIDVLNYAPPKENAAGGPGSGAPAGPKSLVPTKFTSADTSGLRATVDDSGSSKNDFNLK